jgi:hypothetical protein
MRIRRESSRMLRISLRMRHGGLVKRFVLFCRACVRPALPIDADKKDIRSAKSSRSQRISNRAGIAPRTASRISGTTQSTTSRTFRRMRQNGLDEKSARWNNLATI